MNNSGLLTEEQSKILSECLLIPDDNINWDRFKTIHVYSLIENCLMSSPDSKARPIHLAPMTLSFSLYFGL